MFVLNIAAITSLPAEQFTEVEVRVGAINITACKIDPDLCIFKSRKVCDISFRYLIMVVCRPLHSFQISYRLFDLKKLLPYHYPVNVKFNCLNHYDKSNLEQRNRNLF